MTNKYEVFDIANINICNDGKQSDVKICVDTQGFTNIDFNNDYKLKLSAHDLELLFESIAQSLEIHRSIAHDSLQVKIPFETDHAISCNESLETVSDNIAENLFYSNPNDPRFW